MTKKPPPPPPPGYEQGDLFEIPIDRPSQPFDTSEDAADSMKDHAETLRAQVLHAIWQHKGLTQDEFERLSGMRLNTIHPRFWELERRSLIYKTTERRTTRSGRAAIVYHVTERGAQVAKGLADVRR